MWQHACKLIFPGGTPLAENTPSVDPWRAGGVLGRSNNDPGTKQFAQGKKPVWGGPGKKKKKKTSEGENECRFRLKKS